MNAWETMIVTPSRTAQTRTVLTHVNVNRVTKETGKSALKVRNRMSGLHSTAVKRLNRYFCFLLLGFHLPVREKWAKMYKAVSQHNYLSIFLKILTFFR